MDVFSTVLGKARTKGTGFCLGRRQGERILEVQGEAVRKSLVFSVLSTGRESWGEHPSHAQHHYLCPFQALQGVPKPGPQWRGRKHSGTFMPHLVALTPAPGTARDVFWQPDKSPFQGGCDCRSNERRAFAPIFQMLRASGKSQARAAPADTQWSYKDKTHPVQLQKHPGQLLPLIPAKMLLTSELFHVTLTPVLEW